MQIVVLGSFLEREWLDLWQRQQEFTTRLMGCGDVLYVERAAGGVITPARLVGRLRKVAQPAKPTAAAPSRPAPTFLRWTQMPSSSAVVARLNARRVVDRIRQALTGSGTTTPDLVYVGAPNEVWAEVIEMLCAPVWYDMPERFLHSADYRSVDRSAMRAMVRSATLVTADTEIGRADWSDIRDDIVVVEHGGKELDFEPDVASPRRHLYYVGSDNPALDPTFLRAASSAHGKRVRVIGRLRDVSMADAVEQIGWVDGFEIPRIMSDAIAGLVPYKRDEFTAGVLPTKIYDYFLAGAPAISSSLPSLIGHTGVIVAEPTKEGIAEALEKASALSSDERRALWEFARMNSWGSRFSAVLRELASRGVVLDGCS